MANTYTCLHTHIVFSTKHRDRLITPVIEPRLWSYFGGIARDNGMIPLCIGGVEDHRTRSFQEEYLAFLHKHEVEFNERYVFD